MNELTTILTHSEGVEPVSRHLSRFAAGLENSIGVFRPFSARDSHVMHQLKRSAAGAVSLTGVYNASDQPPIHRSVKYIKLLMDSALHAGKAARSTKQVPILDQLRIAMRNSDIMMTKEAKEIFEGLTKDAEQQALSLAIEPTVQNCVSRFIAMDNAKTLSQKFQKREVVP